MKKLARIGRVHKAVRRRGMSAIVRPGLFGLKAGRSRSFSLEWLLYFASWLIRQTRTCGTVASRCRSL